METTKDYSKFRYHKSNRRISQIAVQKIVRSIMENGYIEGHAILVDKNMTIIDGQHRFEACKLLDLPIQYEVTDKENTLDVIHALNTTQHNWQVMDFVNSFAVEGIDCYRVLMKYKEQTNYPDAVCMIIVTNGMSPGALRSGKLFLPNPKRMLISDFLDSLMVSYKIEKHFVRAVVRLYEKIDDEDQIQLVRNKIIAIPRMHSVTEYLIAFENVLNYKRKLEENKIRLL